jgi:hypothetical protein
MPARSSTNLAMSSLVIYSDLSATSYVLAIVWGKSREFSSYTIAGYTAVSMINPIYSRVMVSLKDDLS